MSPRPFRFGVVAAYAPDAETWAKLARRAENLGFHTLLVPDTGRTFSVFPAMAAAASVTSTLRVGSFVLNTPLHAPAAVAQHTMTLDMLSNGRFELGLGAGRPGGEHDAAELGVPWGTPGERVRHLAATIRAVKDALREASANETRRGPGLHPVQRPHPPLMIAGSGPRLLRLAAEEADIVALGIGPEGTERDLAAKVDELRSLAGERFDHLELSLNIAAIGDDLPPWIAAQLGSDPAKLRANNSIALLRGTPDEMADVLVRRGESLGISYVSVNSAFMDQFAPVVDRLRANEPNDR